MTAFNEMRERYGDEFLSLNGFANRNLNFTDFINNFVDSDNVANATIDSNANANMKDICSLLSEIDKPHTKLLAYNKIFYELTKKYGLRTAKEWLEAEWNGAFYLHDAYSASFKPYSYTADQTFYIEHLDEQQKVSFEQFYNMVDVPENYDYENDMFYKDLTNEQYYIEDNADLKATVKSILGKRSKKTQITRVMKHKNTRPIHRITLEDKTSIEVTNDHPIITETETKASRFVRYGEKIWSNTSNDWVGVKTNRVINGYFPEVVYDITTSTGTFICQEQYCHNCLSGDTKFLTKEGIKRLDEMVGKDVMVLNKNHAWEHAVIKDFGEASIYEVVLERYGVVKKIRCTGNHHWFIKNKKTKSFDVYETTELKPEMVIPFNTSNSYGRYSMSPFGVAHGAYIGDGAKSENSHSIVLCGDKDALLPYFSPATVTESDVGVYVSGTPNYFKELPSLSETPNYLYGFLAGYFATDGCIDDKGRCVLTSTKEEYLEFVRNVLCILGMPVNNVRYQDRVSNLTGEMGRVYFLTLSSEYLNKNFFIRPSHKERFIELERKNRGWTVKEVIYTGDVEEVYCAVTDESRSFTLDNNILTGNCFAYDLEDFVNKGLYFVKGFNTGAPKHLTTYVRLTAEFVSWVFSKMPKHNFTNYCWGY